MLYTELSGFNDINRYIKEKIKANPSYDADRSFYERICELYLGIKLTKNNTTPNLQNQINNLWWEFQNIENSINNILWSLDGSWNPDINTFWSYCNNWPRAKQFIDELYIIQSWRKQLDKQDYKQLHDNAVKVNDELIETINTAKRKITEVAFNKIWDYFLANSNEDATSKESFKTQYESWISLVKTILYYYSGFLSIFFSVILVWHSKIVPESVCWFYFPRKLFSSIWEISFWTISSFVAMISVIISILIIMSFLQAHFAWKNYFYHLFLEKENRNRMAIAWTYKLLITQWGNSISQTQQDAITSELTKRLFEPLNTKSSDSIMELPAWELIKSLKDSVK